jgi:hypothetical protein
MVPSPAVRSGGPFPFSARFRAFALLALLLTAPLGIRALVAQEKVVSSPSIAKESRCFEMRTYHAAAGKLEALHARFRNHTNPLFKKHDIQLIGYWVPQDKDKGAEDTLVYILAYANREAREKSWAAFVADPEWVAAKAESEKDGKLVDKVESVFLSATDYSPIK